MKEVEDIDMSEAKKVIKQILFIYLTTTGVFLGFFFNIWYEKLYEELINSKIISLKEKHRNIVISISNARFTPIKESAENIAKISNLHFMIFDKSKIYFSNLEVNITKTTKIKNIQIYDDYVILKSNMNLNDYFINSFENQENQENQENKKSGLYVLIQGDYVYEELFLIRIKVLFSAFFAFLLLALISYFLVKISLKPLENKIKVLNRFIKDSTHEINTPLSVILMSVEQLKKKDILADNKQFSRITLAAKTLSNLYSDLVFFNFSHTISQDKEKINIKDLVIERLEYFKPFIKQKDIKVQINLENSFIIANKYRISKMIDNLLSNAIKYNKKEGFINIILKENFFSIEDEGCGIEEKNLKDIFQEYTRFNKDQGGFGIGLSLVNQICKEYNIKISCTSKINQGSKFTLKW